MFRRPSEPFLPRAVPPGLYRRYWHGRNAAAARNAAVSDDVVQYPMCCCWGGVCSPFSPRQLKESSQGMAADAWIWHLMCAVHKTAVCMVFRFAGPQVRAVHHYHQQGLLQGKRRPVAGSLRALPAEAAADCALIEHPGAGRGRISCVEGALVPCICTRRSTPPGLADGGWRVAGGRVG